MRLRLASSHVEPPTELVGRRDERARLQHWADEAWDGHLRIVTISGEAGIGKTAVVDSLVPGWVRDGVTVLGAACHEDVAVPYLPLLTALAPTGSVTLDGPADDRQLLERAPDLFVRVTDELLRLASSTRVILRLDDLHWADLATLDLLTHVITAATRRALVEPLTLLVVLGLRPLDGWQAVREALERIAREHAHRELTLSALDEVDVNQLLHQLLDGPPSPRLLSDVMDVTEGNPLFVRELVEHLRRTASLDSDRGQVTAIGEVVARQRRLDDVMGAQLEQLTSDAEQLLTVAAHLGDGQLVEELDQVVELRAASLDEVLDELELAGLLLERPDGTYAFTHPSIRQLLVRQLSSRARRDLHLHIAGRLGAGRPADEVPDDLVLRVAEHLRHAGSKAPHDALFDHGSRAARVAASMGAWSQAGRYAELALGALDRLGGQRQGRVRVDLHLLAGLAHFRNHDPVATAHHTDRALDLAAELDDDDARGRALLIAHRSELTLSRPTTDAPGPDRLRRFLDEADGAPSDVRARCWQLMAETAVSAGRLELAHEAASEARRLAQELDDDVLLAEAWFATGLAHFADLRPDEARDSFERSAGSARAGGDDWILAWPLGRLALTDIIGGNLGGAAQRVDAAVDLARRTHHWAEEGLVRAADSLIGLVRNDQPRCEAAAESALQLHDRSSYPFIATIAWPVLAQLRASRLDRLGALEVIAQWRAAGIRGASRFEILVDALTLPVEELSARVDLSRYRSAAADEPHAYTVGGLAIDVELGCRLGVTELLEGALTRLDTLRGRGVRFLLPTAASVDRLRGMATAALGDARGAATILETAAAELGALGAEAERLACDVERCLAMSIAPTADLETFAVEVARQLDAASLLGLLQRLREHLPEEVRIGTRLRRTVVVWDMVDSTQHLVSVGDEAFLAVVRELNLLIRTRLAEHHGVAFKYTGDGVFAWFRDRADALRCALAVSADLDRRHRRIHDDPIRLRAGIAEGQPVDDAGDLFGLAVVTAARLCECADEGEVLCTTEAVAGLDHVVRTTPVSPLDLKGLAAPVDAVRVEGR